MNTSLENKKKIARHNYLLNCIAKWEKEDGETKSKEKHQELLLKITNATIEIEQIRKELNVNTSTVITEKDLTHIF